VVANVTIRLVFPGNHSDAIASLSAREQEVLLLLADGLTQNDIATQLDITAKTANAHVLNIYRKLGVNCAVSAVRCAIRAGLIEP
jgi:DNA-binding NarL/FixJ family response regulator